MRLQSARALGHYLDELHELGGELSLSLESRCASARSLTALADRRRRFRRRAPRRALSARDHRHVFAPRQDGARARPCRRAAPADRRRAAPTRASRSSAPTSTSIAHSLEANGGAIVARGRLRALKRAVDVFGFHLAPIDLRQNSDVHERTVAELFAAAVAGLDYLALSEDERIALLRARACARRARWSRPSSPTARRRRANSRCSAPPPRSARPMAPARSAPRSSPRRQASPTCWSSR